MLDTPNASDRKPSRLMFGQLVIGLMVAPIAFYTAALASSSWQLPLSAESVFPFVAALLITAVSVFLGWRWQWLGLTAGLVMYLMVALTWVFPIARPWAEVSSWTDWTNVVAHGGGSLLVPVIGTVLLCSSIAALTSARRAGQGVVRELQRAQIPD